MFQLDQLLRGFFYESLDHILVSQKVASADGVETMKFQTVLFSQDGSGPAFRRDRVTAHGKDLGDDGDIYVGVYFRGCNSRPQTGSSSPNDQDIVTHLLGHGEGYWHKMGR
jgi:hypothetical protein